MIGRVFGGRYRVEELVGGGGMAQVYRATDLSLGRNVAIKTLRPEYAADEDFVRRFGREAHAAANLTHPNIRAIYDVGQDEGTHYIVMEYIHGETLKNLIEREGPLAVPRALEYTYEILDALETAHKAKIVHRDIKPHNILIDESGRVKVTDFGIARAVTNETLTHTNAIVGSAHYFSPEQARGGFIGERSDLYSVGVVLYELLTNRVPFEGESPISVAVRHLQDEVMPPRKLNPNVPGHVEAVILKALEKDPADRYQSAAQMKEDVRRVAQGEPPLIPSTGRDFPTRVVLERKTQVRRGRGNGRRRTLGLLSLAALVIAVAAWQFNAFLNVPVVTVPDVMGMPLSEAQLALEEAGLVPLPPEYVNDDNVADGLVLRTDPPAEAQVKRGREVHLTVSKGPALTQVPNLIGKHIREVQDSLAAYGLVLGSQVHRADPRPEGEVIGQDIAAGTEVRRGVMVNVEISTGPQPVPVPNVIGLQQKDAEARLRAFGLEVGRVDQYASTRPVGEVLSTNPEPDTPVAPGTPITLLVSGGASGSGGSGGFGGTSGQPAYEHRQIVTVPGPPGEGQFRVVVKLTYDGQTREINSAMREAGRDFQVTVEWNGPTALLQAFVNEQEYFRTDLR